MGHIIVYVCCCNLCSHTWLSAREELPNRCAKCKSTHWDKTLGERASEEEKTRSIDPEPEPETWIPPANTRGGVCQEMDEEIVENVDRLIASQSIAEDTPVETPAKRTKRPVATAKQASKGLRMCRHGFAVVDGI